MTERMPDSHLRKAQIATVGAVVDLGTTGTPDRLSISAQLFADIGDGTRLRVSRGTMGASMPREGVAAIWKRYSGPPLPDDPDEQHHALEQYRVTRRDVEDAINQLLGRDREQHRPPRLSWEPLIELLASRGITASEDELIATPFVLEFSESLLTELAA
jgi:hypothetical protein